MVQPGFFILDGHTERPGIKPDQPAQNGLRLPGDGIPIFFKHQNPSSYLRRRNDTADGLSSRRGENPLSRLKRVMDKAAVRQGENRLLGKIGSDHLILIDRGMLLAL
jgi:hypothetical protein